MIVILYTCAKFKNNFKLNFVKFRRFSASHMYSDTESHFFVSTTRLSDQSDRTFMPSC